MYKSAKLGRDGTRLWLEGPMLTEAGFVKGKFVKREWTDRKLVLSIVSKKEFDKLDRQNKGKVSGGDDRPIIDITGEIVRETFGKKTERVDVSSDPKTKLIVITS